MHILKNIGRWLCAGIIALSVALWITSSTLNATFLSRSTVISWLKNSGVYDNALESIFKIDPQKEADSSSLINNETFSEAMSATFPSAYLESQTSVVVNAVYDWLEGKTNSISFAIQVQDKAEEFRSNLAAAVVPALEALPECSSSIQNSGTDVKCLPAGSDPSDYANRIIAMPEGGQFLEEPITDKTLGLNVSEGPQQYAPAAVAVLGALSWAMPVAIVVFGAGYVLLTDDKLLGLRRFGRKVVFSALLGLIGGVVIWVMAGSLDAAWLVDTKSSGADILSVVQPLARLIATDSGRALTLYAGIIAGVGAALWLAMVFVMRRRSGMRLGSPAPAAQGATPMADDMPSLEEEKSEPVNPDSGDRPDVTPPSQS